MNLTVKVRMKNYVSMNVHVQYTVYQNKMDIKMMDENMDDGWTHMPECSLLLSNHMVFFSRLGSNPFQALFKWSVSRDFRTLFFHDSNPSGPLINRVKYFIIRFQFHQDVQFDSTVWCTPQVGLACGCVSVRCKKKLYRFDSYQYLWSGFSDLMKPISGLSQFSCFSALSGLSWLRNNFFWMDMRFSSPRN